MNTEHVLRIDRRRFAKAPCYICGYNGEKYYQPGTHPCASLYHAAAPALPAVDDATGVGAECRCDVCVVVFGGGYVQRMKDLADESAETVLRDLLADLATLSGPTINVGGIDSKLIDGEQPPTTDAQEEGK